MHVFLVLGNGSNDNVPLVSERDVRAKVIVTKHLHVDVSGKQTEGLVQESPLHISLTPLNFVGVSVNGVIDEDDVLSILCDVRREFIERDFLDHLNVLVIHKTLFVVDSEVHEPVGRKSVVRLPTV